MKLLIVLSVVAYSYADKLDRTYLPPTSAASAGGSPGSINAPFESGVGVSNGAIIGQTAGSSGPNLGFGQFGSSTGPSRFGKTSQPGFGQTSNTPSFGQSSISGAGFNQPSSPIGLGQSTGPTSFGQTSQANFAQRPTNYEQGTQGSNNFASQSFQPERAQASADRNAEILRYDNNNDGDSFAYNFETSNGIAAEESGQAANGVQAQGGFSYTGDDGQRYSLTYTADENGYNPQGDHLPTPPPIPDEIIKSIQDNARAAASGTQEGAYQPDEYESSPQQSAGSQSYNRPQGSRQSQSSAFNQQGSQGNINQIYGAPDTNLASLSPNQRGLNFGGPKSSQLEQGKNQGLQSFVQQQPNQFRESSPQSSPQGSNTFGQQDRVSGQNRPQNQILRGPVSQQEESGYQYNRPQSSQFALGVNKGSSQLQPGFSQSTSFNRPASQLSQGSVPAFPGPRASNNFNGQQVRDQTGITSSAALKPSSGNSPRPFGQFSGNIQGPTKTSNLETIKSSTQGSFQPLRKSEFGPSGSASRPFEQYPGQTPGSANLNKNLARPSSNAQESFRPSGQRGFGPASGSAGSFGGSTGQSQGQLTGKTNQGIFGQSPVLNQQNQESQGSQYRGSQSSAKSLMPEPYYYDRPGSQRNGFSNNSNQGPQSFNQQKPGHGQGNQSAQGNFGGPRQPPSFSPEEGYKY